MACVDLPAFPLQLLIRKHPEWRQLPAVVVDHDKPQGLILWSNERARRYRILPGMRYATGLSIDPDLHAGVITEREIETEVEAVTRLLWTFTPGVEASSAMPGVFWLDATGLVPLYPSFERWAAQVRTELSAIEIHARVAVGFTRFGTFAGAKAVDRDAWVFANGEDEITFGRAVPIDRLDFTPKLRDTLYKLGVRRLGEFIDLPAAGLRRRFGHEAFELHQLASGEGWDRLDARAPEVPLEREVLLDQPEGDLERLLAHIELHLRSLARVVGRRFRLISEVQLDLTLDDGTTRHDELRPAEATLDLAQWVHLIRLRWESATFPTGVVEIRIAAAAVGGSTHQESLFADGGGDRPPRDLAVADRALAQVRAQLGDRAVSRVELTEGHLPEAQFRWRPFTRLVDPEPHDVVLRPLVRRIYSSPLALPPRSRHEPDGWMLAKLSDGPVEEVIGPHRIAGGWWLRDTSRAYYYVRTKNGRWLWIYHDLQQRRWYVQGEVE